MAEGGRFADQLGRFASREYRRMSLRAIAKQSSSCANDSLDCFVAGAPRNDDGYLTIEDEGRPLPRRHVLADFGAQFVDQLEALARLDMPEGPAVAGFRALRHCAHAVDRADLVAEHDGAVGAHECAM